MSGTHWPSGIGATTGDALVVNDNVYVGNSVIFLDSINGNDANDGLTRTRAKRTFAAGVSASAAYGVLVLIRGFSESLTATQTVSLAGLTIVGEGSAAGVPESSIRFDGAGKIDVTAAGVSMRNILLGARTGSSSAGVYKVSVSGHGFVMSGCRVECGDLDEEDPSIQLVVSAADYSLFENTSFVSVATSVRPDSGLSGEGNQSMTVSGCTFDGGTLGFSLYALNQAVAACSVRGVGNSLLRGAVVKLHADSDGYFQVTTVTGGGRVEW